MFYTSFSKPFPSSLHVRIHPTAPACPPLCFMMQSTPTSEILLETQALAAGVAVQEGREEGRGGGWGQTQKAGAEQGGWTGTLLVL